MKKSFFCVLAAVCVMAGNSWAQLVDSFDDIEFWVGTGANRSALIFDFHSGGSESSTRQSWVWGYRWDGPAGSKTGADLIAAITAADANLTVTNEFFVSIVTYVVGSNTYTGASDFFFTDVSWGYYIAGGQSPIFENVAPFAQIGVFDAPNGGINMPVGALWSVATSGSGDRLLADGSWDAWSFGPYNPTTFDHETPPSGIAYAAIPEPTSALLIGLGVVLMFVLRRKRISGAAIADS